MASKSEEVNNLQKSLQELVNNKDFLTDFQKANYNILITNYHDTAENLAADYDSFKSHYDKLKDTDPKKSQYKAKLAETENNLNPLLTSLNSITTEINNMETLINKINEINTKLDNLKVAGGGTPADLSKLATKEDINEVKTSIGNIKITPTDLTPLSDKVDGVDKKIDNIKPSTVDLTSTNEEIKGLGGKIDNLKFPNVDFTPTNDKITGLETKLDTIKTNTEKPQTVPCPCDIKGLTDQMAEVKKQLSSVPEIRSQKQKKAIDAYWADNGEIKGVNVAKKGKYPIFCKNKEEWITAAKDPAEQALHNRPLPLQDPKTKMWGIIYATPNNKDNNYWVSPANKTDWTQETAGALLWQNSQGISKGILSDWGFYDMNKENSQEYSFLWSIGIIYLMATGWNKTPMDWNWDYIKDESKWRPQAEKIIKQYDN